MTDCLADGGVGAPASLALHLRFARLVTLVVVALLVFGVASASAVQTHAFSSSFGSAGAGAGQLSGPASVAVNNQTHDVYVADTGNVRVSQFSASGTFIRAFGWGVADGLPVAETCTLSCEAGVAASGALATPTFIAVDNSAGASAGDVYVGDTATNAVFKFDATGNLVTTWGSGGRLDGSTATDGPFGALAGMTVDTSGTLDVFDTNTRMFEFGQNGSFSTNFTTVRGTSPAGLSVDAAGTFFKVNGDLSVEQFGAAGDDIGQVTTGATSTGIATELSTGDLYVDNGATIDHYTFTTCTPTPSAGCTPADSFGAGALTAGAGLAVDPSDQTAYAADAGAAQIDVFVPVIVPDAGTDAASSVQADSAVLNGHLDPAGGGATTDCHFEYVDDTAFQAGGFATPSTAPCAEGSAFSSPASVHAALTGLTRATTYHARLVVTNANGTTRGGDQTFTTQSAPTVGDSFASEVGTSEATVNAVINPHGLATTYRVEYGSDTSYGTSVPAPDAPVGSGTGDVSVRQLLSGLSPDTTYHYRVVATNLVDTVTGPDRTFHTTANPVAGEDACPNASQRTGYAGYLLDCRAYEQVSPVDKNNTDALAVFQGVPADISRSSTSGDGLLFATIGGQFAGEPSGAFYNYYLSRRGATGWATHGINAPIGAGNQGDLPDSYGNRLFTGDLDAGVVTTDRGPTLTSDATVGQGNVYLSDLSDPAQPTYRVLTPRFPNGGGASVKGASADLTHVVFESRDALTADAPLLQISTGYNGPVYAKNIYERVGGTLRLVNIAPDGTPIAADGNRVTVERGAVSADGARIVFQGGDGNLYVRENGTSTVQLDASQGAGPGGGGVFLAASTNGSKVVFFDDDTAGLTPDTIAGSGRNLYLYDLDAHTLTDLTPSAHADVGGVVGVSDDGSYIYYATLSGNCQPGDPQTSCSIFLYHAGTTRLVSTVTGDDYNDWQQGGTGGAIYGPVSVTPDGSHLVFQSQGISAGYDNAAASGDCGVHSWTSAAFGPHCPEVYVYDASSDHLTCVSCNPTGARPQGASILSASAPGVLGYVGYGVHSISDDGQRVFFNSGDALSARDANSIHGCAPTGSLRTTLPCQDVYEWEADGSGSCHSAASNGGCLKLISSGSGDSEALFLDASPDGRDVFFATRDQLVGQDNDNLYDVYDARAGGGISSQSPPSPSPPCAGDACKGALGSASSPLSAATVSFAGPGNATPTVAKAIANVRVSRKTIVGERLVLTVKVPARGRITISGAHIKTARKSATKAGTYKITVSLSTAGRRLLKAKHRLKLTARVGYTPGTGDASSATVAVTLKSRSGK
ncbi:hypothetical protein [Baekduia sp.]|jgi:hypothetical protein|uniref:hypothetical protein n=1 Tax=Baekduia sp. TaxID=2600305 RepID=UPI002E0B87FD|nr:hypothetical protein [Baekduia sp.]